MTMLLCHNVQVSGEDFVASSPDEKALLEVARDAGFKFLGKAKTFFPFHKSQKLLFQGNL